MRSPGYTPCYARHWKTDQNLSGERWKTLRCSDADEHLASLRMPPTSTRTKPMSTRTKFKRVPARGAYDRDVIDAILDEALIAHLGFVDDGQPYAIPTLQARIDDTVYIHGSAASRAIRGLTSGIPACLTVTLLDGLVLARSAFNHSINYR